MHRVDNFPQKNQYMEAGLEVILCCSCDYVFSIQRPGDSKINIPCPKCKKLHRILLENEE